MPKADVVIPYETIIDTHTTYHKVSTEFLSAVCFMSPTVRDNIFYMGFHVRI